MRRVDLGDCTSLSDRVDRYQDVKSDDAGDGVEQECLDRVIKATSVGWFAGPISSAILLAMLSGSANGVGLWVWFLLMNLTGFANYLTCRSYLRKRATADVSIWIPGQLTSALYGGVIGALNLLAFPASNHPEARALTVIFVCGAMATEIVEKAAKLSWFLSFNVPLACVSTIGLSVGWSTPLFGLMVAVFFAFCLYANRQAGATLRTAIETRTANAKLAEALGEHIFEWFLRNKRREWRSYKSTITPFELERYLRS